ncbi:MAG: hypothetical protein HY907_09230 [Deltaproteobacteria bacterium]|nr:hypothetical protein [Deltaproteobacteria bacterium]
MRHGRLTVKRVRKYRIAKYPSRHRDAKRADPLRRRLVRAAAVPAAALGLGAAGGACDGGLNLAGTEPDAADATDAAEVTDDASVEVELEVLAEVVAEVTDDAATDVDDTDSMIAGGRPEGVHYVRYLTEAEGRALIAETVVAETATPANPCEAPVLAERALEDESFFMRDGASTSGVAAEVDLLAPEVAVETTPECPGGLRPAVGFEFATEEAGDDEDLSGDPDGLTDTEEAYLGRLRDDARAAVSVLRSADHPYDVWDYDGYIEDYDRARAEEEVRQAVRDLLDALRRDGLI